MKGVKVIESKEIIIICVKERQREKEGQREMK